MSNPQKEVTVLLNELNGGNPQVVNALIPIIYQELYHMAQSRLNREKHKNTLNATSLVHEAYLKLVDQKSVSWKNRSHFFAIASQAMRRIIINYVNERLAQKRGGKNEIITLNEESVKFESRSDEVVLLDEALERLEQLNPRQSKVIEYWFFVGLTHEEIAELLEISVPTVRRDWRLARAWLNREYFSQTRMNKPVD